MCSDYGESRPTAKSQRQKPGLFELTVRDKAVIGPALPGANTPVAPGLHNWLWLGSLRLGSEVIHLPRPPRLDLAQSRHRVPTQSRQDSWTWLAEPGRSSAASARSTFLNIT